MERSVTFKLVGDGGSEWDEPMGALSKVVLVLADKRLVLPVLDHDVHRQTLRLGDAPLSVSMAIELGQCRFCWPARAVCGVCDASMPRWPHLKGGRDQGRWRTSGLSRCRP